MVLDLRAAREGRIWYDPSRAASWGIALALSEVLLALGYFLPPFPCAEHEIFGHRRRSAHRKPVVVVLAGADVPAPALAHAVVRVAARLQASSEHPAPPSPS